MREGLRSRLQYTSVYLHALPAACPPPGLAGRPAVCCSTTNSPRVSARVRGSGSPCRAPAPPGIRSCAAGDGALPTPRCPPPASLRGRGGATGRSPGHSTHPAGETGSTGGGGAGALMPPPPPSPSSLAPHFVFVLPRLPPSARLALPHDLFLSLAPRTAHYPVGTATRAFMLTTTEQWDRSERGSAAAPTVHLGVPACAARCPPPFVVAG